MELKLSFAIAGMPTAIAVCDATARALEQALWLANASERAASLTAVLQVDPGLACFFAAQLLPVADCPSPGVAELAALAAESLSVVLADALEVSESGANDDPASRAAEGVVRAELVRRLAEEHGCQSTLNFELSALVLSAAPLAEVSAVSLAEWLVQEVGLPDSAAFTAVAENLLLTRQDAAAADNSAGGTAPAHTASAQLLVGCEEIARRAEEHWRQVDGGAAADLLRLVRRLAPLESLQAEFSRRLETEKLLAMKELAYGAGHEINNPLANISVRAQTLIKAEQDPERRRMLAAINGQVYRAHEMIADLMLFAQPPRLEPCETELQPLLERTVAGLLNEAVRQKSELLVKPAESNVVAKVDPIQLALALHAMIVNSLEAMGQGGRIELEAKVRSAPRGKKWAEIRVADDGPGIDDRVRQHLFDPFFSGREAGRGLGFGLSKCWRIVTAHGGRIDVESAPGRGACFTIALPA